jgi:hypothetical protein
MGGTIEPDGPSVNASFAGLRRIPHPRVETLTFQDYRNIAASVVNAITKPGRDLAVLKHVVVIASGLQPTTDPLTAARLEGITDVAIPGMAVHDMVSEDAKQSGSPVETPLDHLKRILYFETEELTDQDFGEIGIIVANAIGHDRDVLSYVEDMAGKLEPRLNELQMARLRGIAYVAAAGVAERGMAFGDPV